MHERRLSPAPSVEMLAIRRHIWQTQRSYGRQPAIDRSNGEVVPFPGANLEPAKDSLGLPTTEKLQKVASIYRSDISPAIQIIQKEFLVLDLKKS